jgi:hypothetical protein
MQEPTWQIKGGERVPLASLEDDHLKNVQYYLVRKIVAKNHDLEALEIALSNAAISIQEYHEMKRQAEADIVRFQEEVRPVREEVERRGI